MHDHPLMQALMFAGVVGAAIPLMWTRQKPHRIWIAHLAMTAVMAGMLIPGGTSGWVSVGMGTFLLALAMWISDDSTDHSTVLRCATDLTAMAIILLFVVPTSAGGVGTSQHHEPQLAHGHHGTATISTWLGPLVLICWAAIVLYPLFARRGSAVRETKIAVTSGVLMLAGMVPMAM